MSGKDHTLDQPRRKRIIHIVYLIAALDITWMFLQFSVTPVSILSLNLHVMSQREVQFYPVAYTTLLSKSLSSNLQQCFYTRSFPLKLPRSFVAHGGGAGLTVTGSS